MNVTVTTTEIPVTITSDETVINATISVTQPTINATYSPVTNDGLTTLYTDYVSQGGELSYEDFFQLFIDAPQTLEDVVLTLNTDW